MSQPDLTRENASELVYDSGSRFGQPDKYGGTRDVILSPQERARLIELKKADVANRRPLFSSTPQPVSRALSQIASDAKADRSIQTFLQTGVVDKVMIEGFAEMGSAVALTQWASIQNRYGLTDAQLNSLKAAHANYFGLALTSPAPGGLGAGAVDETLVITDMPTTSASKPNVLLLVAAAVVGLLVIRKVLN
jgi:hypothetical protein